MAKEFECNSSSAASRPVDQLHQSSRLPDFWVSHSGHIRALEYRNSGDSGQGLPKCRNCRSSAKSRAAWHATTRRHTRPSPARARVATLMINGRESHLSVERQRFAMIARQSRALGRSPGRRRSEGGAWLAGFGLGAELRHPDDSTTCHKPNSTRTHCYRTL